MSALNKAINTLESLQMLQVSSNLAGMIHDTMKSGHFHSMVQMDGLEFQAKIPHSNKRNLVSQMQSIWNETIQALVPSIDSKMDAHGKPTQDFFPLEAWINGYLETFEIARNNPNQVTRMIMDREMKIRRLLESVQCLFPKDDAVLADARMEAVMVGMHDLVDEASLSGESKYVEHFSRVIHQFVLAIERNTEKVNTLIATPPSIKEEELAEMV